MEEIVNILAANVGKVSGIVAGNMIVARTKGIDIPSDISFSFVLTLSSTTTVLLLCTGSPTMLYFINLPIKSPKTQEPTTWRVLDEL